MNEMVEKKKLKESYDRLIGIKSQYTEAVKKVNDLVTSRVRTPVTMELIECYKKAVDDLKLEFEDEKSTFEWYKKVKNKTLTEAEIKLSPDITYNPNATFSLRDLAKKADEDEKAAIAAEQERVRREEAKVEVQSTIDELHKMIQSGDGTEDILDMLFEALVPPEGKCETVAGEMVRAMMRLLYRLGLGLQENKEEQLLLLSKTVSSLQNKAREQKYKERLEKMEKKTMVMLFGTGGGIMGLLMLSMTMMMGI